MSDRGDGGDRGPVVARFEESASDLRALSRVRTVAALLALLGACAMLLGKLPLPLFLVAVLAILLSAAWLAQARRVRKRAALPAPAALVVYAEGMLLAESERETFVPFREVARIEVDEERLDIVLTRHDGSLLRVEPRYAGVDIHELVRTLDEARRSARPG